MVEKSRIGTARGFARAGLLGIALLVGLTGGAVVPSAEAQVGPLTQGRVTIQGNRLTIFSNAQTTDANQVLDVGEQAQVRTCFGGPTVPCGSVRPGDPRIAGLEVRAELRGPELPEAQTLTTVPGGTFLLPGFQQEGDYRLENIRMVSTADDQVVGFAEPSIAVLQVRQIVLASATVRTLSLEELQARGITLTEQNFQAFDFAVGFALEDEIVEIRFPVLYTGNGQVEPLGEPRVVLDGLPDDAVGRVARWKPPRIVPFRLDKEGEPEGLDIGSEGEEELVFPVFGAIVIPGTITYLNQFFEAELVVANGAPGGSDVTLEKLRATLKLPRDLSLRLANTDPPVAPGQEVPIVGPGGLRTFGPGQQGSAAWTLEGLRPGTHVVSMDILGDLVRPGRDPLPVLSRAQAAVEVVDARFNLTFSHPNVVQEGSEYTLYVTVTNQSQQVQNLVSVEIRDEHMTGARPEDPNDDMIRTIDALEPNQSVTVEYDLVSELTGKVVATTFQSDTLNVQGTILLRTGVGELGIPLSPATLIMPRFTEYLQPPHLPDDELVRSHVRLYSLAYSLAAAPTSKLPPGVPFVKIADVERRAIDLAEAGQRLYLQDQLLESLEALALDQLGNRHALAGYDELRRRTNKGLRAAAQIGRYLRQEQGNRGFDAFELFDHFAETMSYTRPFMMAALVPETGSPAPELQILDQEGNGLLAGLPENEEQAIRTLPWGEIFTVNRGTTDGEGVALAMVGRMDDPAQVMQALLVNSGTETARGHLVMVVPDGETRSYRKLDLGLVSVAPGTTVAVDVGSNVPDPSSGGFRPYDFGTGAQAGSAPILTTVPLPPFRVIGSRQDFRMDERGPDPLGNYYRPNRYGNGITYLFNRPPDKATAQTPENWRIYSSFEGETVLGEPTSGATDKVGTGAWLQPNSERVVNVRYSGSVSAFIDPTDGTTLSDHEHRLELAELLDTFGNGLSQMPSPPIVETTPLHVGGLVEGKVVRGTGETVPNAKVELIRPREFQTLKGPIIKLDLAATYETDETGRFFFDYIEHPNWDHQVLRNFVVRATVPEGDDPLLEPADKEEVSSIIRQQNKVAKFNIALLGRGSIKGKLVYLDTQQPVPGGRVLGASTLFNEIKNAYVDDEGNFELGGLPVGPITLTGSDKRGRKVYATVGIDRPGEIEEVVLEIQRNVANEDTGNVIARVIRLQDGERIAGVGARVAVYSNGNIISSKTVESEDGTVRFDDVPVGRVSLQAADFRVSRTPAFTDLILEANETQEVELKIADADTHVITGLVLFRDPITNTTIPIEGAVAFIEGPGNFAYTDATGRYRIEGVPSQGVSDPNYQVHVIDFSRQREATVPLPPILDVTEEVVEAQAVILESMRGSVRGVALDPLGRPVPGAEVVLYPYAEGFAGPDGSFEFENVPLGDYTVVIHVGDGLQPGKVGWFGTRNTKVIYGGHSPFVSVRMRGGGGIRVKTRTATSTGILTPIYYRPTYYSDSAKNVLLRGQYFETSTNPLGDLELNLPVGDFELVAYNPFHGVREIRGEIEYPGQIKDIDILFEDAGKVRGMVVGVDGVTPVPDVEVFLHTKAFEPQRQFAGPDGSFQFELVPKGPVVVTAKGFVGTVERVGRTQTYLTTSGQEIDIIVQMKKQGSITGEIKENINGVTTPLAYAQYYVKENSYPFRRLPAARGTYFTADAEGKYEVSHIFAGRVTVEARDAFQVTRKGSATSEITADWQVREMPDIVMKTSIGDIEVLIRDPATGGPVADAQVKLSTTGEWTVSGPDGIALWESVPLGTYSVYAFYAPTGQSGRVGNLRLTAPGQLLRGTVYLDQRGTVGGTLWEDALKIMPVPGGTVRLSGNTAGGRVVALATTSGQPGLEGTFSFEGIPEGTFQLEAGVQGTPRRASAEASLTDTNPEALIDMILEPIDDLHFLIYEKLNGGNAEVDTDAGIFSLRLTQPTIPADPFNIRKSYDFTRLNKTLATGTYFFPNVLMNRGIDIQAQEITDEQRSKYAGASRANNINLPGDGTLGSPYQLLLGPKAVVRVTVIDGQNQIVPQANVSVRSTGGGNFPGVSNSDGQVTFYAVPAGSITATATNVLTGFGGRSSGSLVYDDDVLELTVKLASAVSAQGVIYAPLPDDADVGDPSLLVPKDGAIVQFKDSSGAVQVLVTGPDGRYRFDALRTGGYTVEAQDNNGDQFASLSGSLSGPDGFLNSVPPIVLDASPPRILSITPPAGAEGVSRRAQVEIVFSERLAGNVLPSGNNPHYFRLRAPDNSRPAGSWSHLVDGGRQVVRFTPSANYQNLATYSLTILGSVTDRQGRRLTQFGNVGTNFRTGDSVGPGVLGTVPSFDSPVDPEASIRVDFTEAVVATAEQLDGDGVGDAAELYGLNGDQQWVPMPVVLFLTRQNYSLQVEPLQGFSIDGDTLKRKLVVSGLLDSFDNPMPTWEAEFRIYDENPPVLEAVPFPAEAGGADLVAGVRYNLVPELTADDQDENNPGGDIDRVDYFVFDPEDPASPSQPAFSARTYPFKYSFVGAYTGNGVDPRPFPIWVRAVDTSTNESEVVLVDMQVLPNSPPSLGEVTQEATAPVPGVFYAGSDIRATITGITDPDALQLTLAAQLRREGSDQPVQTRSGRTLNRPSGGWQDLAPQTFTFDIPAAEAEGNNLYVRAWVIDVFGAAAEAESDRFEIADDNVGPQIDDLRLRRDDNTTQLQFFIGERFRVQFRARDLETQIDSSRVEVRFDRDDIFPSPVVANKVSGDLYRTTFLNVPPDVFFERTPVVATVSAFDQGDNENTRDILFDVAPEPDPTAPTATWLTPWSGAEWPAEYSSVLPQDGPDLLLRAHISDLALDENENEIPGTIVEVRFRGPVITDNGTVELAPEGQVGELVAGTGGPGEGIYQLLWQVPNQIPAGTALQFAVRAVDSGGKVTQQVVQVDAVVPQRVFEGVQTTVSRDLPLLIPDEGDENGPVFLLDGSLVSIQPQTDGTVRTVPALYVYSGGEFDGGGNLVPKASRLTAPEIPPDNYNSAITHHNLELQVERVLGVGHGSSIDMNGRGLLGKRGDGAVILLPGQTGPGTYAGGSHGGLGWFGSPSGGWGGSLRDPGETYGSLRDPHLPGGGGGTSGGSSQFGGTGGGVIRLFAENAVVHLAGEIRAKGLRASGGGGAGGAIRLVAGRLEGAGLIDASGGNGSHASRAGGGGGGRISLSYHELGDGFDTDAQIRALGGGTDNSGSQRTAGAGTVFLEQLDEFGLPIDGGRLVLRNVSGKPSAFTPLPSLGEGLISEVDAVEGSVTLPKKLQDVLVGDLLVLEWDGGLASAVLPIVDQVRVSGGAPGVIHARLFVDADPAVLEELETQLALGAAVSYHGRGRLGTIDATGAVRMVAYDTLEMGPDGGTADDDRSFVFTDSEARVALRSDQPVAAFLAEPDGGEVILGSTLQLSWIVADPLGLVEIRERWSLATEDTVRTFTHAPVEVVNGNDPISLFVPFDTPSGEVTYTVTATDVVGRTATSTQTWTVLGNSLPLATVAMADGLPAVARAGYDVTLAVHAEDAEGLSAIELVTTGPAEPAAQTVPVTGMVTDQLLVFRVPADADGSVPVVAQVVVTDATGAQSTSEPLEIAVTPNDVPAATLALADGAAAILKPEESTTLRIQATDPDGLVSVELRAVGPVEPATQTQALTGDTADLQMSLTVPKPALPGPVSVTAVLTDVFGAVFETAPVLLEVIPNALPTGSVAFADGTPADVLPGSTVDVVVNAADDEALAEVVLTVSGPATPVISARPVTGTSAVESFRLTVSQTALPTEQIEVSAEIRDLFGNPATTVGPIVLPIAGDSTPPDVTLDGVLASYRSGEFLSATVTATDEVGVARVDVTFDGETTTFTDGGPTYELVTEIDRTMTEPRTVTFSVTATDFADNVSDPVEVTVDLVPDLVPTVVLTQLPGAAVLPGSVIEVVADVADDVVVERLDFAVTGAVTDNEVRVIGTPTAVETFRRTLPTILQGGDQVTVTVSALDNFGHTTVEAVTYTVSGDVQLPVPAIDLDPASDGDVYFSGEAVTVTATASDNVEVSSISLDVDGTVTEGGSLVIYPWTVPAVSEITTYDLVAEATDTAGNVGTVTRTVTVEPLENAGRPEVQFDCLSNGATLPSGDPWTLTVTATDDLGVSMIELFRDDESTPFAVLTPAAGTEPTFTASSSVTLPLALGGEQTVRYRAVAHDASFNTDETEVTVHVVETVDLVASGGNDWSALETQVGVLRSGTLTLDVPRTLSGLIVLGGQITHTHTSPTDEKRLELDVNGPVYVACGGELDVQHRGYRYNQTYPGETGPGGLGGGSHIGVGGYAPGSTYGSVYRPLESGGGGENSTNGDRGGGVVRLQAQDRLVIDGDVLADGEGPSGRSTTRGGAGGSIWLSVDGLLGGQGRIRALGGNSESANYGSGGGGAIALDFGAVADGIVDRVVAAGGWNYRQGGAGSILLRGPSSVYGDLVLDQRNAAGGWTHLPELGAGVAQAGSGAGNLQTAEASIQPYFVGHYVEIFDGTTEELEGVYRISEILGGLLILDPDVDGIPASVDEGDLWQGAYYFDNVSIRGRVPIVRTDSLRVTGNVDIDGSSWIEEISAGSMRLREGATLTQWAYTGSQRGLGTTVDLSGDLVIEAGASIDVSQQGYGYNTTYPGETPPGGLGGGSHIGRGGYAPGSSYGSVYRPRELGGGGENSTNGDRGGGVVRILAENLVLLDSTSAIRANGEGPSGRSTTRAGAGGSIWITVEDSVLGSGLIEARGGASESANYGSGGGGAVAIEYGGTLDAGIESGLRAWGGGNYRQGGAGSIYLHGPASVYGDLILDNGTITGGSTYLPSLGSGTAQAGSGGALLVTDRGSEIPAYFEGHWIEIRDAGGSLKGTWRVASVSGFAVTFEPGSGAPPSVEEGDTWQGVYRFDNYQVVGSVPVTSPDPIRVGGTQVIDGSVQVREIVAGNLHLKPGAVLTHPYSNDPNNPESLSIRLTGTLTIDEGASIDVSKRGFRYNHTYPGETGPGGLGGGSHIGQGGYAPGSTYGSVYRPQENGGGGENSTNGDRGGGVVRIEAQDLVLDGTIRANGEGPSGRSTTRGGAGGSVWITLSGTLDGNGAIEARGGASESANYGSGGGGAIAVEHQGAFGTVLDNLRAYGGNHHRRGGAGSVYLRGPDSVYGDLIVDNGSISGAATVLPSLGNGVAQGGSGGAVLVTDKTSIQPYFVGHWVEISNGSTGQLEGRWRVISIDGGTLTLASNGAEPITVGAGDLWQGVYLFDNQKTVGTVPLRSDDPIRVFGDYEIDGDLETRLVQAGNLTLRSGARLRHPYTSSAADPERLQVYLTGDLVIEPDAAIGVSNRGYRYDQTYPGATSPGGLGGGSHIGRGGYSPGSTYGSVYRPREAGGGGEGSSDGDRGGGIVEIVARHVELQGNGAIRANGEGPSGRSTTRGGAGGSIWIRASGEIRGDGNIEAQGGRSEGAQYGSGGGGAIAVEHQGTTGTVLENLIAYGGGNNQEGGAGSVYLLGPTSKYGDLLIGNAGIVGNWTDLPSLGTGTAGPGSVGSVLVTDRPTTIPEYFVGHWVEIYSAVGVYRGAWRVSAVEGLAATLESNADFGTPTVQPGDSWQGIYRFDNVTLRGSSIPLLSPDPIMVDGTWTVDGLATTRRILAGDLVLTDGSLLRHPSQSDTGPVESLEIDLTGDATIGAGARIDVSERGYRYDVTYPGETPAGGLGGGSHMGLGGYAPGSTYGSVYRPHEHGGGGENSSSGDRGGGTVRLFAGGDLVFGAADSSIRADGEGPSGRSTTRGGAGGSIWIEVDGLVRGDGFLRAEGGRSESANYGSGGGGAVAVYHGGTVGTALDNATARGGNHEDHGGTGTVYLHGPGSVYGDLKLDSGTVDANRTRLPALGSGVAQAGSSGDLLVTDRTSVQPYFVGHWVEITDGTTGELEGAWRIAAIDGAAIYLETGTAGAPTVDAGDTFQGAYYFDNLFTAGRVPYESADPIRVTGDMVVDAGEIFTSRIEAGNLTVRDGGIVRHYYTTSNADPQSLVVDLTGDFAIEAGGVVSTYSRGYRSDVTYPGAARPGGGGGGSHLGRGGLSPGSTYGSVYRPFEPGGGGENSTSGDWGGGVVKITAQNVTLDGVLSAAGQGPTGRSTTRGGAGGSLWIEARGELSGDGDIHAYGGESESGNQGSGGGGSVALYYDTVSGTLLDNILTRGGTHYRQGGAGTLYLFDATSTHGRLVVDNAGIGGGQTTVLPAFGSGTAQAGTVGDLLVTDKTVDIPPYFVGHWIRVESGAGPVGTWRVASVDGVSVTLEPNGAETIALQPGYTYQGIYRFDEVTIQNNGVLQSADPVEEAGVPLTLAVGSLGEPNDGAPKIYADGVVLEAGAVPGSYRVTLGEDAVVDPDGISEIHLSDGARTRVAAWRDGAELRWTGLPGDRLTLTAFDAHGELVLGRSLHLPLLPAVVEGWEESMVPGGGTASSASSETGALGLDPYALDAFVLDEGETAVKTLGDLLLTLALDAAGEEELRLRPIQEGQAGETVHRLPWMFPNVDAWRLEGATVLYGSWNRPQLGAVEPHETTDVLTAIFDEPVTDEPYLRALDPTTVPLSAGPHGLLVADGSSLRMMVAEDGELRTAHLVELDAPVRAAASSEDRLAVLTDSEALVFEMTAYGPELVERITGHAYDRVGLAGDLRLRSASSRGPEVVVDPALLGKNQPQHPDGFVPVSNGAGDDLR